MRHFFDMTRLVLSFATCLFIAAESQIPRDAHTELLHADTTPSIRSPKVKVLSVDVGAAAELFIAPDSASPLETPRRSTVRKQRWADVLVQHNAHPEGLLGSLTGANPASRSPHPAAIMENRLKLEEQPVKPQYFFGLGWIPLAALMAYNVLPLVLTVAWVRVRNDAAAQIPDNGPPDQLAFGASAIGSSVKVFWILSMSSTLLILGVLLVDNLVTYQGGDLSVPIFLGQKASWEERTRLFIFLWICCTSMMVVIKANASRLHTCFLIPEPLATGELVGMVSSMEGLDSLELFAVETEERCFVRHCVRFAYQDENYGYAPAERDPIPHPCFAATDVAAALKDLSGLNDADAIKQLLRYGENRIHVDVPSFSDAFLSELTSWGTLYQLAMSVCILFQRNYPIFTMFVVISLGACGLKAFLVCSSAARIAEMAEMDESVVIKRNGKWATFNSVKLVPGDIIAVEEGRPIPADLVLLSGFAAVDEAMLTGETMPVQKFSVLADTADLLHSAKKHVLSSGTKVVDSGAAAVSPDAEPAKVGIVVATGALTSRGELIRDILRPKVVRMQHHMELPVLLSGVALYGAIIFLYQMFVNDSGSLAMDTIVGIFNVMQVFSPLLPAALLAGEAVACQRLKEHCVYSLAPSLIVLAGGLRVFCFDKTGTLTEEGLQLLGVHEAAQGSSSQFQSITDMAKAKRYSLIDHLADGRRQSVLGASSEHRCDQASPLMQAALASCHTVTLAAGQPVGNPAEVEMYRRRGGGWEMDIGERAEKNSQDDDQGTGRVLKHPSNGESCEVLRQFEFDHHSMTQSVVVETLGKRYAFCKGAYERLQDRFNLAPPNYLQTCELHAKRGCYVLSVGYKELDKSRAEALSATRDEAENGLNFLGLILFRNEPKPDTAAAVAALKLGAIRMVILTGDNVLTGIHIARKVGLCDPHRPFRLAKLNSDGDLVWTNPDGEDPDALMDCPELVQRTRLAARRESVIDQMLVEQSEELAITGAALAWFEKHDPDLLADLLLQIRVFGRVQPMQKVQVVEWHMKRGLITGMCGDGGNDCGALKAAHIGVALSEAEASVVAPFSASNKSMLACELLVREGCAALVTSFSLFQYLLGTGITFTLLKTTLLAKCLAFLPQMAYKYYDMAVHPWLVASITTCRAADTLSAKRPPQSLLEFQFLGSLFAIVCSNICCLGVVWWLLLSSGDAFQHFNGREQIDPATGEPSSLSDWWKFNDTVEGSVLWIFYAHALLGVGAAVSHGHCFRQPVYANWRLLVGMPLLLAVPYYCVLTEKNALSCLFRTNCDEAHIALAHNIPIFPKISQEFWYDGFWAAGGSDIIPDSLRSAVLVVGVIVICLNQALQVLVKQQV